MIKIENLFNNVYDDVEFELKNLKFEDREIRIKNALNLVGMEQYINADTFKLSLGQKQRINIASSLAIQPKYLLLDEPTTMIDSNGKIQIYDIMNKLKSNKQTIVFITNNINEILLADRILILENGRIEHILTKQEILNNVSLLEKVNIYIPDFLKLIILLNEKWLNINIEKYSVEDLVD